MPERQCVGCRHQAEWGCEAKSYKVINAKGKEETRWFKPSALPLSLDGAEEHFACPRQHIRENPAYWNRVLTLYAMYRKGFLPDRGAVVDQSNQLIEVFRVLDDVNASCDKQEMEQLKQRQDNPPGVQPRKRK